MRKIAANILSRVIKDGQSLTVALDCAFESVDSNKERALIQALCYGVIRQYHRLDFILNQLLSKPLRKKDTDVKILLLMGLYQLNYMRIKPYAAVSETVSAVKKNWAKSLLNAVLRQYIREQEQLENIADNNGVACNSHPEWLIDKIKSDWSGQSKNILLENNKQPPMALRVNLAQVSREAYLKLLADKSIVADAVSCSATAIVLEKPVGIEDLPGFNEGLVSVQDVAAQLAAEILDVQTGHSVLDICAAPGGKTAAILEGQTGSISMLAVDIDEDRLQRVKDNLQRLKLKAKLIAADATKPAEWINGQTFDRILVDAPCSAVGVIRRHPDIKILRRETDIVVLLAIQQQILSKAWELLVPGGVLLYATCSLFKQENELQIEGFLNTHQDASELTIEADWGEKRKFGRQVLTGDMGMDGFYYAKLFKKK